MMKKNYKEISIRLNAIGHLETEVTIDEIETIFLVDTGARYCQKNQIKLHFFLIKLH